VDLPLKGDGPSSPKPGMLFKAKKNLAGKAATSSMGKAVINKILDEQLKRLIASLETIIAAQTSREKADRLRRHTIKIIVKAYFLYENKMVPFEDYQKLEPPLKQALKILMAVYDHLAKIKDPEMKKQVLDEKFTVVAVLLDNIKEMMCSLLSPHLTTKSMDRITEIFQTIATREFLLTAWEDQHLKPDVDIVIEFVKNYIQKAS